MNLYPAYEFEVVTYTPESLVSLAPYPDSLEHLILNFESQEVIIGNIKYKHGDRFTAYGLQAIRFKELYVDSTNPILKII